MLFRSLIAAIVIWAIMAYNRMIGAKNQVDNAWSQIDVQLKRRYDLIPNLVEAAKGYLTHERQTLEAVIAARGVSPPTNASRMRLTRNTS